MHARHRLARARRRGVVLVLILAMLGLLAIIGISFATLAGQSQSGSRRIVEGMNTPTSDSVMDFALTQLINDTSNPLSAIRGHSLKRDMYGNDGQRNGFLAASPVNGSALQFSSVTGTGPFTCTTNVGSSFPWPSNNYINWSLKLSIAGSVTQSFEITGDTIVGGVHVFTVAVNSSHTIFNPKLDIQVGLTQLNASGATFILDGRYRRAFNGPGLTNYNVGSGNPAQYGNFRVNNALIAPFGAAGLGNPDALGMDEDYDSPDLENWFMALQSADGSVVIPSFHRPGILAPADWTLAGGIPSQAKILRPRDVDGNDPGTFIPLIPNAAGSIPYDVDNDGDGLTDSVWLDLGAPSQRDANGKLYKPLFAFTVLGLNGKLPLNTAGNIQGRQQFDDTTNSPPNFVAGDPTNDHVAHLGFSPNEINPKYALQNAPDTTGSIYTQADNAGVAVNLTQLRNLLTGTVPGTEGNTVTVDSNPFMLPNNIWDASDGAGAGNPVFRTNPSVAGRWGDKTLIPNALTPPLTDSALSSTPSGRTLSFTAFNSPVRAGRSINFTIAPFYLWDSADDNQDGLDFFPTFNSSTPSFPEQQDFYDFAGGVQLPSERIRRFVTPQDPSGNGLIAQYTGTGTPTPYLGADNRGRLAYMFYNRPPGLPPVVTNQSFLSVGNPGSFPTASAPTGTTGVADMTNNPYHGFESQLNQVIPVPSAPFISHYAAMPWTSSQITAPTFTDPANTNFAAPINSLPNPENSPSDTPSGPNYDAHQNVNNNYPFGSLTTDLADEMNVYQDNVLDSPFGVQDLEWLYRSHDVDGASLHSRLSQLAPISFGDKAQAPGDGMMRRKMFCGDTFDLINFVYAHDNPDGVTFANNSRFGQGFGASLANLSQPTPQLAVGDRKINLNFPLPVSNDPSEPVRLKWISDAYALMLYVLPPTAVDTAEERAALSQYLINVIDFRDPDGTVTIWQSPDVVHIPAVLKGTGTPAAANSSPPYVMIGGPSQPASAVPLVQYGMEYSPVAITEVLAFTYNGADRNNGPAFPNIQIPRLFIEMVNTLTQSSTNTVGPPAVNGSTLNLAGLNPGMTAGWDLVVAPDDVTGRPDPVTGQLPTLPAPIAPATTSYLRYRFGLDGTTPIAPQLPALNVSGTPSYYVISNDPSTNTAFSKFNTAIDESGSPTVSATFPAPPAAVPAVTPPPTYLIPTTSTGTFATGQYYWLYLRRPANPFDTAAFAGNPANAQMVVVDAFRFPFSASDGAGKPGTPPPATPPDVPTTAPMQAVYSSARFQPYRGGQAVPQATAAENTTTPPLPTAISPLNAYGFSEQTAPPTSGTFYGLYNSQGVNPSATPPAVQTTVAIPNSLGKGAGTEGWSYFPFHDRDFMSVAELLLVPGCPPGLFTKQFVENAPDVAVFPPNTTDSNGVAYPYLTPPKMQPANTAAQTDKSDAVGRRILISGPHTYPYLVEEFYYTATAPLPPASPPPSRSAARMTPAGTRCWNSSTSPARSSGPSAPSRKARISTGGARTANRAS